MLSRRRPSDQRLHIEIWSWATWLVLCVVSYPAVVLLWIAPRAGLAAAIAVGSLLVYAASTGQAGRRDLEQWHVPLLLGLASASAAAALGITVDGIAGSTALFCACVAAAQVAFVWHFLPWLVRDAEATTVATGARARPLGARAAGPIQVRAALALLLILAFLAFGLGAAWARGTRQIPGPTLWVAAVVFLGLALMFVERIGFIERSAREGNLVMPARCHRRWIAAALATLALAAALAAAAPWKPRPERPDQARPGDRMVERAPQPIGRGQSPEEEADGAMDPLRQIAVGVAGIPRGTLALLLLLLLLLIALVLIWGFRRSRGTRWLLRAVAALIGLAAWAGRRVLSLLRRLVWGPPRESAGEALSQLEAKVDPLFDVFDDPDALAALTPREVVIRTYHLALNVAEMLGVGRRLGQTPFEYARALARAAPAATESVNTLTWAYANAMYAGDLGAVPDPSAVRGTWQRIRGALTAGISPEDLDLRRRAYLAASAVGKAR